jgi:hypothetical protein
MQRPEVQSVPSPWRALPAQGVGGLFQVGYAGGSDFLLVLSAQGRGIFDCLTGAKVARDSAEAHDFFDQIRLTADGFGPLAGRSIRMAGLFGGGFPLTTADEWCLEVHAQAWPTQSVFLRAPAARKPVCIGDDGECEMRACGFSETGRSFIIATSCELAIFTRPA